MNEKFELLGKDKTLFCEIIDKIFHCKKQNNEDCFFCSLDAAEKTQEYCNRTGKSLAKGVNHWVVSSIPGEIKEKIIQNVFGKKTKGEK